MSKFKTVLGHRLDVKLIYKLTGMDKNLVRIIQDFMMGFVEFKLMQNLFDKINKSEIVEWMSDNNYPEWKDLGEEERLPNKIPFRYSLIIEWALQEEPELNENYRMMLKSVDYTNGDEFTWTDYLNDQLKRHIFEEFDHLTKHFFIISFDIQKVLLKITNHKFTSRKRKLNFDFETEITRNHHNKKSHWVFYDLMCGICNFYKFIDTIDSAFGLNGGSFSLKEFELLDENTTLGLNFYFQ